jgi:hypothetical protein
MREIQFHINVDHFKKNKEMFSWAPSGKCQYYYFSRLLLNIFHVEFSMWKGGREERSTRLCVACIDVAMLQSLAEILTSDLYQDNHILQTDHFLLKA